MDLTGWLEYFTAALANQLDETKSRGKQTIRYDVLVRQHALSNRQALALDHLMEHGHLAIQDHERLCPAANRRTLQRDLKALVEKGLPPKRELCGRTPRDTIGWLADNLVSSGASCGKL